ncbi:MAG: MFS transporter [Erysipelotrichaceae bacterium]|nr:MFS transporter [Erysipelotrichaceae bacterium]
MSTTDKEPIWTVKFILVIIMAMFSGLAAQLTYPLVARFSLTLNPDITLAGTIAGLMSLMSLFVCSFAGLLSDRFSRKRILQVSSICYASVLLMHALIRTIPGLIILRLLVGVFFSINSVTVVAFSTAFIPQSRIGEGLGYTALANVLAQAAGPAIGLKLVEVSGYPATFILASVSALLCAVVITVLPYREEENKEKKNFSFNDLFAAEFTGFMLLSALFSGCSGLVATYLAILADQRGIANIALFFTVYSLCMVVFRPYSGKVYDRKGVYFVLIPAIISTACAMVLIGFGKTLAVMIAASLFNALGQGAGVPTLQADVIRKLDKRRTGVATSTIQIGQNIGNALAPMAGSFMVKALGYQAMYLSAAALITLAGFFLLFLQRLKEVRH